MINVYLILSPDDIEQLELLNNEEAGQLLRALLHYMKDGTMLASSNRVLMVAFASYKNKIDREQERMTEISIKRSKAGKKHHGNQYSKRSEMEQMEQVFQNGTNVPPITKPLCNPTDNQKNTNGTNVPLVPKRKKNTELKELPLFPLDKETSPIPPIEIKPPIIPQENTMTISRARERFKKPTIEEVSAYIAEKGYNIDPVAFWNFYEANGWVQGRQQKPIKSWKACVVTWTRQNIYNNGNTNSRTNHQTATGHPSDEQMVADAIDLVNELKAKRENGGGTFWEP